MPAGAERGDHGGGGWARAALSGPWPSFLGPLGARGLAEV